MNLVRSFSSIGILTLVSRALGFVRDMLMARFLGAGFASDAFLIAFRLPNMPGAVYLAGLGTERAHGPTSSSLAGTTSRDTD